MAQKTTRSTKVSKKPTRKRQASYWQRFSANKSAKFVVILLVAAVGTYLLAFGAALPNTSQGEAEVDNPARGLVNAGHHEATTGPCKGVYETDGVDSNGQKICTHPDPGPEGVDVRERAKGVDANLANIAAADASTPVESSDSSVVQNPVGGADDVQSRNSMCMSSTSCAVKPVNWPCVGTGTDGYRVQVIYAYVSGHTNNLSARRAGLEAIMRRVNAVFHNSGVASGGVRNVRFVTNSACALSIPAVALSATNINSYSSVESQLRAKGYSSLARKYLVEIEGGTACGYGDVSFDARPTQDNGNNSGNLFALSWYPCWNYDEPHELMHTMGAVLGHVYGTYVPVAAPYSTPNLHCYDQHDVMCYADGSGHAMFTRCTNVAYLWRFDCGNDTYFRAAGATGWLAKYWNTANSRFLSHT